jgi:Dolichyl-phosphate-mannose-protein mannosyltransferase
MPPDNDRKYQWGFYGLLAGHLLIWLSLGMALDLHPDEADHWVWSRFLSWGYYEHPPMIAWVIRLCTTLLGDTQWAMEVGSQGLTLLVFVLIFQLARRQFGVRAAFFSVLLLEAAPLYAVGSMIFIIDTPLMVFYSWAAVEFWRGWALKNNAAYYRAGIALGLALLSKFTAILFLAAAFLFLVSSPERRKAFRNPHLWTALVLGLLIFSPFLYWNHLNGWISLGSQLEKGLTGGKFGIQALAFVFGQPLILGPVLFFLLAGAWTRACLRDGWRDDPSAYLLFLTGVPLLVFTLAAFKGKYTDPSWGNVAWLFGAVLLGKSLAENWPRISRVRKWVVGGAVFLTGWFPVLLIAIHIFFPYLPVAAHQDRTLEMRGWRELGRGLAREYTRVFPNQEKVFVVADDYQLAGVISFYTPQHPWPYSFGKSARNIWTSLPELKNQGALLVCYQDHCPQDREKARGLFSKIDKLREIQIFRKEKVVKTFEVFYVRN